MRNRDGQNTGRADFVVPASRQNATFFDVLRWQKPSECCPGDFTSTSMVFSDGTGPGAADITAGGYHWPKGVQGMERHTGRWLWAGNPGGGETIGRASPAFSPDGTTVYVINDAWDHPLMAFPAAVGPSAWRGLANPADPNKDFLGVGSPTVAPDGRIFSWGWNSRAAGVTDTGAALEITWVAGSNVGTCFGGNALYELNPGNLRVVSNGRFGTVTSYNGATGSPVWSRTIPWTDCPPTIDPANGNIYIPAGSGSIWVVGLSRDGGILWGSNPAALVYNYTGQNTSHVARATGCLSHDGLTFYFQTTTNTAPGQGRLWAIHTPSGTVKWSCPSAAASGEQWDSCPIVTPNGVLVVGNNEGDTYLAVRDDETHATILDTFMTDSAGTAAAVPSLSADGLLYLPVRTPWIVSNGNTDIPTLAPENVFTAFDLNHGAQMYEPIPEGNLPAPAEVRATPFRTTALIEWGDVPDPRVAGYVVYRRMQGGRYTVPYKRVLARTSFTDCHLAPGASYYYKVLAIDGAGAPVSRLSVEVAATPGLEPWPVSVHKNFELLMVFYTGGYSQTDVHRLTEGLKRGLEFYWRTTRGRMNMDVTWLYINTYPPGDSWYSAAVLDDLRRRGVQDDQYDLGYLVGNNLAGCLGGYVVFRSMCAALGTVCGVPYPGKDPNTDYTIAWTFTHELHHALEVMENITPNTPEVLFDHFPWCYPDPLGPTGWHMDWSTHYDGIALTNREYGDNWMSFPAPYDGYIECIDLDMDDLPDNDARVRMDEARCGTFSSLKDTDRDGLDDLAEFSRYNFRGTDPRDPDSDDDGILDGEDHEPLYPVSRGLPLLSPAPTIDGQIEASWPLLRQGYYFTQNAQDFTLRTYAGYDAGALYFACESSRQLRFMISIDGSGVDGRFESPVRHPTGATDTYNLENKGNHIGDAWSDGSHLYTYHNATTVQVYGGSTVAGAAVASSFSGGLYRTEVKIPRALPKGAAYVWYPPDAPVVDGLTLAPGHVIGLNVTCSNISGSSGAEYSGTWTGVFETHALVDFSIQQRGDAGLDGDFDLADFAALQDCYSGAGGGLGSGCAVMDLDSDGDVDAADFVLFGVLFAGPRP
ncbi:MAG: hypothetical protein AB1716_09130 [Planctomycetota bacterium]